MLLFCFLFSFVFLYSAPSSGVYQRFALDYYFISIIRSRRKCKSVLKPNKRNWRYSGLYFAVSNSPLLSVLSAYSSLGTDSTILPPQWGAADAEIKLPSGENTDPKRSPFKARMRSVYSHTRYTSCQGFLPRLLLHFRSIHLHFFQTSPDFFFLCWLWLPPVPV